MKSAFGIIAGILSLISVGLARVFTADVPINTGYRSGSVGDSVSKGIAHSIGKYFAILLALGAIIFAGIGILVSLVTLFKSKSGGEAVKTVLGMVLCAVAIYFGVIVFKSVTR